MWRSLTIVETSDGWGGCCLVASNFILGQDGTKCSKWTKQETENSSKVSPMVEVRHRTRAVGDDSTCVHTMKVMSPFQVTCEQSRMAIGGPRQTKASI